jgi:beta-glucosidase
LAQAGIVDQHGGMSALTPFAIAVDRVRGGADHHAEAARLVEAMTIEEKLGCLDGDIPFWPGLFDMTSGGYYRHAWPAAVVERLGIPGLHFADGPRGCVIGAATAFPVSMARGASFDVDLEEQVGDAIGTELRASGATYTGAVCMNLLRHPAWGRAQETYGEDPHHVGELARALTVGLQRHVMACMKHFALNSMENARFSVDVTLDERALHEVYLPHFRKVAAAGVASVMSAYNSVNGEWCGENKTLLTTILRDEWGWDGFVTSDFIFGLRDSVKSVQAGLDIEMPFRQQRAQQLAQAIAEGSLSIDDVNASVQRTVATFLRFARVFVDRPDVSAIVSPAHAALARRAAVQSMVLLRNERQLLPVQQAGVQTIAVLGRLAAMANLGDGGSSDVHPPYVVTPLEGICTYFPDAKVLHSDDDASIAQGADLTIVVVGYTKADEGEYVDQAGTAKVVAEYNVFPPIDHPQLGASITVTMPADAPTCLPKDIEQAHEDRSMAPGGDRSSLRLSPADEALIATARAKGSKVVVCVMAGSAVVMPWAKDVDAVIMLWYPGMEGGNALGEVLSGVHEPGGRLPFVVPIDESDLVHFDKTATAETYELFHGQWKLDRDGTEPHFAFGAGVGYTTWELVGRSSDDHGGRISVEVRNTGSRVGSTVVMVMGSVPRSAYERPIRRLVGFARVTAEPGTTVSVDVPIDVSVLDVRVDGRWLREAVPVEYTVLLTGLVTD